MARNKERIDRLTLQELLRMTPSEIKTRANTQCSPMRRQYSVGSLNGFQRSREKRPTYYNEQRVWMRCTDGKRKTYLRFFGTPAVTTPVWAWCDCPYFKYYLEVALTKYGCSSIKSSNGKPPVVRNPQNLPYLCKHLVVTAKIAVSQRQDLAKDRAEKEMEQEEAQSKNKPQTPEPIQTLKRPTAPSSLKKPPAPGQKPEPQEQDQSKVNTT